MKLHEMPNEHTLSAPHVEPGPVAREPMSPLEGTPEIDPAAELAVARHELFAGLYSGRTSRRR